MRPEYVPEQLPFRDAQISALAEALAPALRGSATSNLLLYGKTGTGKTAVAKYVLSRLAERSAEALISLSFAYSNARIAGTQYRLLADVASALNLSIPFTGLATKEVSERILLRTAQLKSHVVIVLDEIDFLVRKFGDDTLYELTRAHDRLANGRITLIGISNDLKFKDLLDPRVVSSLSEEEIVFPPYTADELKTILRERAESAFFSEVLTQAALSLCAALAGSEHGDARRALDLLRVSAEVAEREGANIVEERHVRIAIQKIERDRMVESLRSLPPHEKLVLMAALESSTSTGELYDRYASLCSKLRTEPLTRRRVSALLSELDLLGLVSVKLLSQGRYGRTKKASPLVSAALVREALADDPSLSPVLS